MDRVDLLFKIKSEASEIEKLITEFSELSDIPQIDIDLTLDKVRCIYDNLLKLKRDNKSPMNNFIPEEIIIDEEADKPEIEVEIIQGENAPTGEIIFSKDVLDNIAKEKIAPKVSEKEELTTNVIPDIEKTVTTSKVEENIIFEEIKVEKVKEETQAIIEGIIKEDVNVSNEVKTPEETNLTQPKTTLADQFISNQKSVNDQIADNTRLQNLASRLQGKPISDLKSEIGLNDRFLFTNELFSGNNDNFNSALDNLNGFNDLDEAMDYLNNNLEWNTEKESFNKFLELVYRRYIPTENQL